MDNMVDRLVEIEKRAKSIVDVAKQEESKLTNRLEKLKALIENQVFTDTERIVKENQKREAAKAGEHIAQLELETMKHKEGMLALYKRERENWVQEIFNNIIG